jgi:hypothetical protein
LINRKTRYGIPFRGEINNTNFILIFTTGYTACREERDSCPPQYHTLLHGYSLHEKLKNCKKRVAEGGNSCHYKGGSLRG